MKQNFEASLDFVLAHEGGWVDHPQDPGGATMKGVTLSTYSNWLGRRASKDELRNIPQNHLREIYKTQYWDAVCGDDLPSGVDYVVFDMAVNSGPGRAARTLQTAAGTVPDGKIGQKTLAIVKAQDADTLIATFQRNRQNFLESLSTFATFGKGWTRRVNEAGDVARKQLARKVV